jgi:hypothetical protein
MKPLTFDVKVPFRQASDCAPHSYEEYDKTNDYRRAAS